MLVCANNAGAVPAAPGVRLLTQADGSTIQARQWGDERVHGWETVSGFAIVRDSISGNWVYASVATDGSLVATSRVVGRQAPPTTASKHLRPVGTALNLAQQIRISQQGPVAPRVVPPAGVGNVPVLLMNFSDRATTYTAVDFETLLFGAGNNSMSDFYSEISYGVFTVSSGPSGVANWGVAANIHDYYGTNTWFGDQHAASLVIEAVQQADAAGFNFAPYDVDGDCFVDVVAVVHQGSGEEAGGPATDIWSHRWNLASAAFYGDGTGIYTTNDVAACGNIKVNDYIIQPETLWGGQQTMGVFAHEYGHALGLPDLYDTDYSSEGLGSWALMAGGSWNSVLRSGDSPAHMSAWSKSFLGWVTPTQVTGSLPAEPITQASAAGDVYQFLTGVPGVSGEYFLLENRQQSGFDAGLPGSGLAIWHVEESKTGNTQECYPPLNCSASHYKVALEQADGLWDLDKNVNRGDAGDLYPGTTGNTVFDALSAPDSSLYAGFASNASVSAISASGPVMTATLSLAGLIPPVPDLLANGLNGPIMIAPGSPLNITVALNPGDLIGQAADWWVHATTPFGEYWYATNDSWSMSPVPVRTFSGSLINLAPRSILNMSTLPLGTYIFHFSVDGNNDGIMDETYLDSVQVTVQ